jgi:hypothetical protein
MEGDEGGGGSLYDLNYISRVNEISAAFIGVVGDPTTRVQPHSAAPVPAHHSRSCFVAAHGVQALWSWLPPFG